MTDDNRTDEALLDAARKWLADDPDADTRRELSGLIAEGDMDAIADRFAGRLEFGTAGIRGEMGAGPARMNRLVVRQVTAGLAAVLLQERSSDESPMPRVVVGFDARHKSEAFARDAAAVLRMAGLEVSMFEASVPTPLVAFATRYLDAAAGVQITASHNPPRDNGYKVYWRGGAQIVAPLDVEISEAIAAAPVVGDLAGAPPPATVPDGVVAAYRRTALGLLRGGGNRDLRIVYTPLHGVAGGIVTSLLREAGFANVHPVADQFPPDPDFPTVDFPNPEIAGVLDRAETLAGDVDADLVLANDPDGDRIAVAVPAAASGTGFKMLTGDEVGCLLADILLREGLAGAVPGSGARLVATTVVSSQLLGRIAEDHGVEYAETLTGFKWLATAVDGAVKRGVRPVVCYEQALGVMLDDVVRDKDGITAALVIADIAARLAASGGTLRDELDDLARRHGLHLTAGRSVRLSDDRRDLADEVITRLREDPPRQVMGIDVVRADDYGELTRRYADGRVEAIRLPAYPLMSLALADGSRLQVRPSGTEPLLKFYIEVVEPVSGGDVDAARPAAEERLEALADGFVSLVT